MSGYIVRQYDCITPPVLGIIVFAEVCWLWIHPCWVLNLSLYRGRQNVVFPALLLRTLRCKNKARFCLFCWPEDRIKHTNRFAWARGFRWIKQHFRRLKDNGFLTDTDKTYVESGKLLITQRICQYKKNKMLKSIIVCYNTFSKTGA